LLAVDVTLLVVVIDADSLAVCDQQQDMVSGEDGVSGAHARLEQCSAKRQRAAATSARTRRVPVMP